MTIKDKETIQRAVGIIEGVTCGVTQAVADMLITAVGMIDCVVDKVENFPAADVAPVVRCKDCRWGVEDDERYKCTIDAVWVEEFNAYSGVLNWYEAEHFCGYGVRRETDG